jgi:hypothetical protein
VTWQRTRLARRLAARASRLAGDVGLLAGFIAVPSSGCCSGFRLTADRWHDSPPHRPSASRGIAYQGISGKGVLADQLHWRPQFVNLVEIISSMLAWRESSGEELDMRCRGTQCNSFSGDHAARMDCDAQHSPKRRGDLSRKRLDMQGGGSRVSHE